MDPICLDNHLNHICDYKNGFLINKKTGRRISAICPVHVFGNPANCIELKKISDKWSIPMVEDAEALGSYISDKHCGLIGDIGILSFNGNKIITTGGGGALITNDVKIAERAKHISNTAKLSHKWEYFHDQVGWNDRMPNINAALGLAQLEKISEKIKLKKLLLERYLNVFEPLNNVKVFQDEDLMKKSNNWMISLLFEHNDKDTLDNYREEILKISHKKEIFLRPAWKLLSDLPMYISSPRSSLKNASNLVRRLINIPSSPQLMNNFNH